jgi:multidrug efflux system membrane fusion protein
MPLALQAIGTVEAASSVSIHAQVTGQLTAIGFTEGDNVQQNAVIFELDRRPLEAAVRQADAVLQKDIAQAQNARAQAERAADLAVRGIATAEQRQTAQANADALSATIDADRAALENARIQLQYATIRSPLTGRTGSLMVHVGSLVRANDTTPLVVINQLSPINVEFAVPESQLAELRRRLAAGRVPVLVSAPADAGSTIEGRVTFVDNAVDQTTGTIKIKGSFTNADRRLWPGQFVNVTVTLANEPSATVVPTPAVQTGQDGMYVFVVKPDHTVDVRPIKVERAAGDDTIVSSGVAPDETVVTDGQLRLVPGSRVTVKSSGSGE